MGSAGDEVNDAASRLPEYVRRYADDRQKAVRSAIILVLTSVIVAVAGSNENFLLKDPVGLIEGKVHMGHVIVWGPAVIWLMAMAYWVRLAEVVELYDGIHETLKKDSAPELLPVEWTLLRPPLLVVPQCAARTAWLDRIRHVVAVWIVPLLPPLVSTYCYLHLLVRYLSCRREKTGLGRGLLDHFFGTGGILGIKPACSWAGKHASDMPWIYPPLQSWVYVAVLAVLGGLIWWTAGVSRRAGAPRGRRTQ